MSATVAVKQTRGRRLGSSHAPVVLGLIAGKGPINAWLDLTGRAAPEEINDLMVFGRDYEPVIRAKYVERTGTTVWVPSSSLYHSTLDWLQATPDGIAVKAGATPADGDRSWWSHLLECKAPKARSRPLWGDHEVPAHVLAQVIVQMAVTDLPFVDVVAEIDREYIQRRVQRDEDLERETLAALADFWRCVELDTPPAVDATESYADYLKAKLERSKGMIKATAVMEELAGAWRTAEAQVKKAEAERDLLKNLFLEQMAIAQATRVETIQHGAINLGDGQRRTDWKAAARDIANTAQLHGIAVDIDAVAERFTTQGTPILRRPQNWSKE